MRKLYVGIVVALGICLGGLYISRKHGGLTPSARQSPISSGPHSPRLTVKPKLPTRYLGRTPEEWGAVLQDADRDNAMYASRALRVLGPEGRSYLIQGLQNANPETRRICLETLSVSDLRACGEQGRQLLISLAGDQTDLRIRERANLYLSQWNQAVPSPP